MDTSSVNAAAAQCRTTPCRTAPSRRQALAEIALVFAVFFVQGATPVPDVNEPYYLGKTIHYWDRDFARGDFFLPTPDAHAVFYFTFGWLSRLLAPTALAWTGRLLTWLLLAWAWRRLCWALLPRRWFSVLSAALLVCLIERCHMAGEWLIGGVEAKGFAYVLVLLGIEAVVRNRFHRAWLLFGAAAAFHVLVGGWSVVALALAWLMLGNERPDGRAMWPALLGGLVLSLPGLVPSLALNWGADAETVRQANLVYVYERLPHHLAPERIPLHFLVRFVLLAVLWGMLWWKAPGSAGRRRLHAFVGGAVGLALAGAALSTLRFVDASLAAGWLRFYWFRLADVMVPVGVAVGVASWIAGTLARRPAVGRRWLLAAIVVAVFHLGSHVPERVRPAVPPADQRRVRDYTTWRQACHWIAHSGQVPPHAVFLTPRMAQTFKWYARRGEVVNWKEIPQDAGSIVEWWRRIRTLHETDSVLPAERWRPSLAALGGKRLCRLGEQYGAEYAITIVEDEPLALEIVYANPTYVIYRLREVQCNWSQRR